VILNLEFDRVFVELKRHLICVFTVGVEVSTHLGNNEVQSLIKLDRCGVRLSDFEADLFDPFLKRSLRGLTNHFLRHPNPTKRKIDHDIKDLTLVEQHPIDDVTRDLLIRLVVGHHQKLAVRLRQLETKVILAPRGKMHALLHLEYGQDVVGCCWS